MALINCPECNHDVSDKAIACPNCGYPITSTLGQIPPLYESQRKPRTRKKHKKLPNKFGSIKKLSGNRSKPYAAYPPTTEFNLNGSPVTQPAIGYFADWYEAFDALREYNHNPYDIEKSKLTFEDVYKQWFHAKFENAKNTFSKSTEKAYSSAYKNCSKLYNTPMVEIRKNEMQSILDGCPLGFSSVRNIKNLFSQMFSYSIENGILEKDYSQFVQINIEDDNEKGEPFTEDEIRMLWKNHNDPNVQIILIMIYSGLRIGEMKITEIDLEQKCFRGGLKTKVGRERVVPIHKSIYEFVQHFNQDKFNANTFRDDKFYPLIQSIGMPPLTNGKKHTPHDCRHTFSWLADKYMMDDMSKHMIMGHSLGKDVERSVYGHRTFEQLQTEINKITVENVS